MLIDEGCRDLRSVAPIAAYADGIVIKLSKCGGIREALRMIHAARALDLKVMLGCMIESELGIAQAAQLGSLADYIDLDGHLLISSKPFDGLGLRDGRLVLSDRPGLGVDACLTASRSSPAACSPTPTPRPPTASCATRTARSSRSSTTRTPAGPRRRSIPYARREVPIVAASPRPCNLGANVLVIGVAPFGGALTPEWRAALLDAMLAGMHVEAGLHTVLSEDAELAEAAAAAGVELRDLRAAPPGLSVPPGPAQRPDVRVVHTVGSDCAIGKMSVTLELDAAARARGLESAFVATGQTGIAISGWGIAVDHVISDFIAGAAARLVQEGAERAPLLFVEGQGALQHPAYSGVTLGLLHGCLPDALVLCHRAGTTVLDDYRETRDPAAARARDALRGRDRLDPPGAACSAIALNTRGLDDDEARAAIAAAAEETGLPATDPVRFGADALLDALT